MKAILHNRMEIGAPLRAMLIFGLLALMAFTQISSAAADQLPTDYLPDVSGYFFVGVSDRFSHNLWQMILQILNALPR